MAIMGHQIGPDLVKALGLPRNTASFTLRAAVDEVVSVQCEYYPDALPRDVVRALAEYTLVPLTIGKPAAHRAEIIGFNAWMRERAEAAHQIMMARSFGLI